MCEDWRGKCQTLISCLWQLCCGSPDKCRWMSQDLVNDICKVRMIKDLRYITSADLQAYTIVLGCSLAAPAPGCWGASQRSGHCGSLFHHPWLSLAKFKLKQTHEGSTQAWACQAGACQAATRAMTFVAMQPVLQSHHSCQLQAVAGARSTARIRGKAKEITWWTSTQQLENEQLKHARP